MAIAGIGAFLKKYREFVIWVCIGFIAAFIYMETYELSKASNGLMGKGLIRYEDLTGEDVEKLRFKFISTNDAAEICMREFSENLHEYIILAHRFLSRDCRRVAKIRMDLVADLDSRLENHLAVTREADRIRSEKMRAAAMRQAFEPYGAAAPAGAAKN